jgi:hypothetical protein
MHGQKNIKLCFMISAHELSARRTLSHCHIFLVSVLYCNTGQICSTASVIIYFLSCPQLLFFVVVTKVETLHFSHSMNATSQLGVLPLHIYTVTQIWNTQSNFDQSLSLSFSLWVSLHMVHHQLRLWVPPLLDDVCKQAEFQMRFHPEKLRHFLFRDTSSVYHVWLHLGG